MLLWRPRPGAAPRLLCVDPEAEIVAGLDPWEVARRVIADALAEARISVEIDVRDLLAAAQRQFLADYAAATPPR